MAESDPQVLLFSGRFQVRGSCAYTLRLARHLPEQGISVRVVCPHAGLVEPSKRAQLAITEYAHFDAPIWGRLVLQRLLHDISQSVPDVIHIQSRKVLPHGTWLARQLQRPFVLTIQDYMRSQEKLRIDWNWCRKIITVSESVRRDLSSRIDVPPGRLAMIHSGVDVMAGGDIPPPLVAGHVPVVGTAGPLEAVKGLPFFLGAARKVLDTGRDVEFLIAGAGPEEANLRRMARDLGLADKVTFVPYVLDFTESLTAMDIFCLPSLQQGLGTIMLEAMALGKPVIASRVGGVYSVVHEQETGLLVPPSSSSKLADRILELLGDPPRARAIGEAARQMVRRDFALERMVSQTADLYRNLIAECRSQPIA
jgi:glycosyltransferase involved in cell wall biosynthesis